MASNNQSDSGPSFNAVYVNPSRRDLIKQLVAIGAVGAAGIDSPLLYAGGSKPSQVSLTSKATWKNDVSYEEMRRSLLWMSNGPARYPDLIVQAKSESEIRNALQFAAGNDLRVACRSSGHNTSGAILRNGGMLLDISSMADVSVDAAKMTAYACPASIMYAVYQRAANEGLFFPVAECYTVALGGYLLGGGYTPLGFGLGGGPACYSVISADVILASGEKVTASKDENADLYWAIRGVGPAFFGVITRYQLQLYQHPETIMRSTYTYRLESLPEVISILDDMLGTRDERVHTTIALTNHPKSPDTTVASLAIVAFTDKSGNSEARAGALLARYARSKLARLAFSSNENEKIRFSDLMVIPDRTFRVNTDNIWTNDARALLSIVRHFENKPSRSRLLLGLSHGHRTAPYRSDACYSAAGAHYLSTFMFWRDSKDDDANTRWYEDFARILRPYTTGHYVNEIVNDPPQSRIRNSFSTENWRRLAAVRKKYDPGNRFYGYVGFE